jgi:hypothetical protein
MNYYATYDDENILDGFHSTKPLSTNYVIVSDTLHTALLSLQFKGRIQFIGIETGMEITIENIEIIDKKKIEVIDKTKVLAQQVTMLTQQVSVLGHMLTKVLLKELEYECK